VELGIVGHVVPDQSVILLVLFGVVAVARLVACAAHGRVVMRRSVIVSGLAIISAPFEITVASP
jgi:hypothetical protein